MARPKKRGVKPGTKRGPYKKAKAKRKNKIIKGLEEAVKSVGNIPNNIRNRNKEFVVTGVDATTFKIGDVVTFDTGTLPSLISDLTSTIDTLEAQLTAQIDRIKSILV